MMRRMALLIVLGLIAGAGSVGHACAQCGSVVVNELLAGPTSDWNSDGVISSRDDEWVEIYNTSGAPVTLDGLYLRDLTHKVRYGFTGTLASHATLVVYGGESYAWEGANAQSKDGLSLNNSGDTVDLIAVSGTDTLVCDSRVYGSNEGASERSVGRLPDGSGTWVLFDALNLYTGTGDPHGTGCMPTPGHSNQACNTPVLPSSWGTIKSLYRAEESKR